MQLNIFVPSYTPALTASSPSSKRQNCECTASMTLSRSFSSITTDMLIWDAPCVIISRLMPFEEKQLRNSAARPTLPFMSAPITLTMARPSRSLQTPSGA